MSSGKKFSDCMYCIHYKGPNTEVPCNTCEKEKPFADPSQFKMSEEDLKKYEKLEKKFLGDPVKKTGIYAKKEEK